MPRIRKTSTQPKRKTKKPIKIVEKVYPEYIENFKKQIQENTPFTIKVDTGMTGSYNVGVIKAIKNSNRCIWMCGAASGPQELEMFWVSEAYRNWKQENV